MTGIGVPRARAVAYATRMENGWTERDSGVTEAGRRAGRWLDVKRAAEELGLSSDAVRKRIARGTLPSRKERDGSVWVRLDGADGRRDEDQPDGWTEAGQRPDELVEELRDQVSYLRERLDQERAARTEERRRHDTLMQQLMARLPELEAPRDEPHVPESFTEEPGGAETPETSNGDVREPKERSWWRRVFGF